LSLPSQRLTRPLLMQAIRDACAMDVQAFKPGNVSLSVPGHGMEARHFLVSAELIAEPLTEPGASVGQRIFGAIQATRDTLPFNTNLGIVLMIAPLVHAAMAWRERMTLEAELRRTLAGLSVQDADLAYRAIRLAEPGGLGTSERHDVRDPPAVTLLAAMREAAERDIVARQYSTGFADVFELAVPRLRAARARWDSDEWAMVATYLTLLARTPDTHIARTHGLAAARQVSDAARLFDALLGDLTHPHELLPKLRDWDEQLKQRGWNPGATADLSVAAELAVKLEDLAGEASTARTAAADRAAIWHGLA